MKGSLSFTVRGESLDLEKIIKELNMSLTSVIKKGQPFRMGGEDKHCMIFGNLR